MFEAHQQKSDAEFFRIVVRFDGRKLPDIRWDKAGHFKVIAFEPGDWERMLNTMAA